MMYVDGLDYSVAVQTEMIELAHGRAAAPAVLHEMELIAGGLHAPVEPSAAAVATARDPDSFDFPLVERSES
jgi:hypothetical protein